MGKWIARLAEKSAKARGAGTDGTDRTLATVQKSREAPARRPDITATTPVAPAVLVLASPAANDPTERPYSLSPAELGRAHARPWDDAAIARFQARAGRFVGFGFSGQDAEDLAERLTLRDAEEDARGCCLECLALSGYRGNGFRCSVPDRAGLTGGRERSALGADFVVMLQHCPGLRTRGQQ